MLRYAAYAGADRIQLGNTRSEGNQTSDAFSLAAIAAKETAQFDLAGYDEPQAPIQTKKPAPTVHSHSDSGTS